MRINGLKRFVQEPSQCAVAACACIGHFYNKAIDYDNTKTLAISLNSGIVRKRGLDSAEIGLLLNTLGFKKVTIISSDLEYLDYSWTKLSKVGLIEELLIISRKTSHSCSETAKLMVEFLKYQGFQNELIIDHNYGDFIRGTLSNRCPVLLAFDWSLKFKMPKRRGQIVDPISGEREYHVVVGYGYNENGVFVIDSHEKSYKYKLKKFRKGKYMIPWEEMMITMASGDLIIPEQYHVKEI